MKLNVGIIGATGEVGRMMLKVMEEKNFPVNELRLYASPKSKGKKIIFKNKAYYVENLNEASFSGLDLVFGAVSNELALKYAKAIVNAGAIFIDNSSAFRMNDDVPLVVPEINMKDAFKTSGIIANPNCSTIITLTGINAINKLSKIKSMVVTTFQAVSGAGQYGIMELVDENERITHITKTTGNTNPKIDKKYDVFAHQIASNVIPQISSFLDNGYTKEEMKMQNEGRKILHNDELLVDCTCVRVPVIRSHSISVDLITEDELDIEDIKDKLLVTDGVILCDDPEELEYPMPILTSDQDLVYVGRIRKSLINKNGISLFVSGDQIRKGAATNAIDIAIKYFKI